MPTLPAVDIDRCLYYIGPISQIPRLCCMPQFLLSGMLADNGVDQMTIHVNALAPQAELQAVCAESWESLLQSNVNEQYAHRKIFGLQPEEDCRSASVNFFRSALHITITDIGADDIEAAHPVVNNQRSSATAAPTRRPVFIQFCYRDDRVHDRDKVIYACKSLKGTKCAITEDLASLNLKTMNRLKNDENTWSWNGKLFAILTNGKKVQVRPFQLVIEFCN